MPAETPNTNFETAPSPLQQEMEAERHEKIMATVHEQAAKEILESEVQAAEVLREAHGTLPAFVGPIDSPYARRAVSLLHEAAIQTGTHTELKFLSEGGLGLEPLGHENATIQFIGDTPNTRKWDVRLSDPEGTMQQKVDELQATQNQPLQQMAEAVRNGARHVMTTERYTLTNPRVQDTIFAFMHASPKGETPLVRAAHFVRATEKMPRRITEAGHPAAMESATGLYRNMDGTLHKMLQESQAQPGVYQALYFEPGATDIEAASFHLGAEIHEARASRELSGNSKAARPFLETKTGHEVIDAFAAQGLNPSERLRNIFEGVKGLHYSHRWGNNYAELTREIARYIDAPKPSISRLFEGDEATNTRAVAELPLENTITPPAAAALDLLKQAVTRTNRNSDIPVYENDGPTPFRASSCKDAELRCKDYAQNGGFTFEALADGKVVMAQGKDGNNSYDIAVNLNPFHYKGVDLPSGALFRVVEGEYLFLRLTTMAFDEADAKDAFTWQYHNAEDYRDGSRAMLDKIRQQYANRQASAS